VTDSGEGGEEKRSRACVYIYNTWVDEGRFLVKRLWCVWQRVVVVAVVVPNTRYPLVSRGWCTP